VCVLTGNQAQGYRKYTQGCQAQKEKNMKNKIHRATQNKHGTQSRRRTPHPLAFTTAGPLIINRTLKVLKIHLSFQLIRQTALEERGLRRNPKTNPPKPEKL
jgi:hypothetical protein